MVKQTPAKRPWVYLNVAISADGKIAPPNRKFVPFSSRRDQELLMELRTDADAVMAGARTIDSVPVNLGPGGLKYRKERKLKGLTEYNLRVIVSGSGSINPSAIIWKYKFSPIIVLTREDVPDSRKLALEKLGAIVKGFGVKEIDLKSALQWLAKEWGVKKLLCEGGGALNAALFQANLVDEVFTTLCPIVFAGGNAPTLADGKGIDCLKEAVQLQLKSYKRVADELFLRYQVNHK